MDMRRNPTGYSTGALARGDFRLGIEIVKSRGYKVIELSALRDDELAPLMNSLDELDLSSFSHISVHAPSKYETLTERQITQLLRPAFERNWLVIVHPDIIQDFYLWDNYGTSVCIENMDKRKKGRTVGELEPIFQRLPCASFCLDVGHADQVGGERNISSLLSVFSDRLLEVHMSEVDENGRHGWMGLDKIELFMRGLEGMSSRVPIVFECEE